MTRPRLLAAAVSIIGLAACANPYHDFYHPNPNVPPDARTIPGLILQDGPLKIYSTSNLDGDVRAMRQQGWLVIGNSSFNSGGRGVTESNLRAQADKVGAQAVLLASKYTNTVSGAVPLVLPDTTRSYTTGSATAYGPGGTVNAYGSATTTTYGTTTTMMPYSVNRFDVGAVYMVRMKQHLGLFPKAITDEERQKVQTNSAVVADFVVEGSPAFKADIFPGDIVLSLAGQAPSGPADFLKHVGELQGQEVEIVLRRGDQQLTKRVTIDRY